ncbi:MAG TPA: vWA domain-containing protein [Rectinemataceae bacterium]|nr:vWA domain-containing protein [Rectinemataceae bacterium]
MRTRCVTAALLAAFIAAAPLGLSAAGSTVGGEEDPADVVVLLDVSQSILPYFSDVTDFVVTSVVRDYLRLGDTFHLLSFGDTTQVEISEKVVDDASVKSFLGRLYLLYPLARHSDFAGALAYLYQYLSDLPESRQKVVVVITDGINNPPEGSLTYGMPPEKVGAVIDATAAKIRANGWPVHFIKLPLLPPGSNPAAGLNPSQVSASEAKGGQSYIDEAAKALGASVSSFSPEDKADIAIRSLSLPRVEFPAELGKRDYAFSFPLKVSNPSETTLGLELDRLRLGDIDVLAKKSFLTLQSGKTGTMDVSVLLPDSLAQGHEQLDLTLGFAGGLRVNPQHGLVSLTLERNPLAALFRSGARIVLFLAIVAIGLFLVFLAIVLLRRIPRRGSEAPVVAAVMESAGVGARPRAPAIPAGATAPVGADAAALLADSAGSRRSAREAEAARQAELLAEAGRKSAPVLAKAGPSEPGSSVLPSAAELAAAKRAAAEREAALLAEAASRRAPGAAVQLALASKETAAPAAANAYVPRVLKAGTISVELRVDGQNQHIGLRNVHELHAGTSRSLGGGRSDFLIFLVPMPHRIAELHFDGEKLAVVPLRPEFFPEGAAVIEDCLGRDIHLQGRRGYPLVLSFHRYERPADKMNRLLHCIEAPGLFVTTED